MLRLFKLPCFVLAIGALDARAEADGHTLLERVEQRTSLAERLRSQLEMPAAEAQTKAPQAPTPTSLEAALIELRKQIAAREKFIAEQSQTLASLRTFLPTKTSFLSAEQLEFEEGRIAKIEAAIERARQGLAPLKELEARYSGRKP